MRSWFLVLLLTASMSFGQVNVDCKIDSKFSWSEQGTEVSITTRASFLQPFVDSVDVILDTYPDLGPILADQYPTIAISCPSLYNNVGYEMSLKIQSGIGLVGHAPDSALVIATVDFVVPYSLKPETDLDFGILFFGWSDNPPSGYNNSLCADVGFRVTTPNHQVISR